MAKTHEVSNRMIILSFVFVVFLFITAVIFFFGYYARGISLDKTVKKLEACEKAAKKPQQAVKKPQPKIAKRQVAKPPVTAKKKVTPIMKQTVSPAADSGNYVPAPVPAPRLFTLRLNVVEWNDAFSGDDLSSRRLGPAIRGGMADGSIKRASAQVTFKVEWRQGAERLAGKVIWVNGKSRILPVNFSPNYPIEVVAQNGLATIEMDPAFIGLDTVLFVWPQNAPRLASPPRNLAGEQLPLITTPGELEYQIRHGISEVYMHFIVSPAAVKPPPEKKNPGGPKGGLPPLPLFL